MRRKRFFNNLKFKDLTDNTPKEILAKIDAYAKEYTPRDIELMERVCSYYQEFFEAELKEKDEQLKQSLLLYQNMCNQIAKDNDEIERLKGLIEDAFYIYPALSPNERLRQFSNFKTENQL